MEQGRGDAEASGAATSAGDNAHSANGSYAACGSSSSASDNAQLGTEAQADHSLTHFQVVDWVRTYPTFRFGGVEGTRVCTVAFRRTACFQPPAARP